MRPPGNHKPADAKVHRPRSELRVGRNSAHHGQPEGQERDPQPEKDRLHQREEKEEGQLGAGGLGAEIGEGQMTGPNSMAGAATSTVTANTFIHVFITNILLSPDMVTGLRPSLGSLGHLLSVSLAQEWLVQITFPPFASGSRSAPWGRKHG